MAHLRFRILLAPEFFGDRSEAPIASLTRTWARHLSSSLDEHLDDREPGTHE